MNVPNDNKEEIINKLEINLLDTINDKDIFERIKNIQNIRINDKNKKIDFNDEIDYLTENYQLDINEIVDENSDININEINNQINENYENYNNKENNFNDVKEKNGNENYKDFNSFMRTKKRNKEKNIKTSKSFSSNKIKYKKISSQLKEKIYKNRKAEDNNNNEIENKEKKIKYSKEKIELNKQRINKLYNDYKNIINKRENMKKELSKDEIKDCSFSPKINNKSKKMTDNNKIFSKPIFLRYNDDNSRKKNLTKKYELNFSHIPKINKNYKFNLNKFNIINDGSKIIKNAGNKNKNLKINSDIIKNSNILKRQILLEEYIRDHKIYDLKNEEISLNTSKTATTSKSKFSIKKNINSKNNINKSFNYPIMRTMNLKKNLFNNTKVKKSKKISKNKSFYLDYIKGINDKLNLNFHCEKNIVPIISINKMDKYFKQNYSRNFVRKNKNREENVIKNFVDKINSKINAHRNDSKGIDYNITEQCINIKKILLKNKGKFRNYK